MQLLTDEQVVAEAQRKFSDSFTAGGAAVPTKLSHPAHVFDATVYWLEDIGIWGYFGVPQMSRKTPTRFWNVFGIGKPVREAVISCEINPPIVGVNRNCAGAFVRDGEELHVMHRGAFNAFRGAIPREQVREQFNGVWLEVDDAGRQNTMLHVGKLSDQSFLVALGEFVREVKRFKDWYRQVQRGVL